MKFNQTEILESVVAHQLKSEDDLPNLSVGDTIDVHQRIIEGGKERTQVFQGVLIGMKGRGINRMITVRRIVANEGVERIFPLHSPKVAKIEIVRHGDARRAKLYYLRDRVGKSRRLRDRRRAAGLRARRAHRPVALRVHNQRGAARRVRSREPRRGPPLLLPATQPVLKPAVHTEVPPQGDLVVKDQVDPIDVSPLKSRTKAGPWIDG